MCFLGLERSYTRVGEIQASSRQLLDIDEQATAK